MWEKDGSRWWYKNGKLHREDGPAIFGKMDINNGGWMVEGFGPLI